MVNELGAEVLTLRGKPINWARPPKPTDKVLWSKKTTSGRPITGSLRTIAHLDRLDALAKNKGWKHGIEVIQPPFNTGVSVSSGTHDFDAVSDLRIPGVGWYDAQAFLRANGFGCWYRHPPLFTNHLHGFTLPPAEGKMVSDNFKVAGFKVGRYVDGGYSTAGYRYTSSQLEDYYNHAFGLSGQHIPNSDKSWYPKDINRTIFNLDKYIARRVPQKLK